MIDGGRLAKRAVTDRIGLDLGDLRCAIAERRERVGHGAVDDLEIAAARELLELHQREIGLDSGRVAIHDEADRAGRRDHRGLCIAKAMPLAARERRLPGRNGVGGEPGAVFAERGASAARSSGTGVVASAS